MVMLNSGNVKSESEIRGAMPPLPGRYHVVVVRVDESFEHSENIIFEFRVLAGTMPGQEQCIVAGFFKPDENGLPKLTRLALALGLLRPGEQKDVDFADAIGRQLIIGVEEFTSKKGNKGASIANFGMDTWSLANPEVADVPRDLQMLQFAQALAQREQPAAPQAAPVQQPQAAVQQPVVAAPDDPWGNV